MDAIIRTYFYPLRLSLQNESVNVTGIIKYLHDEYPIADVGAVEIYLEGIECWKVIDISEKERVFFEEKMVEHWMSSHFGVCL